LLNKEYIYSHTYLLEQYDYEVQYFCEVLILVLYIMFETL